MFRVWNDSRRIGLNNTRNKHLSLTDYIQLFNIPCTIVHTGTQNTFAFMGKLLCCLALIRQARGKHIAVDNTPKYFTIFSVLLHYIFSCPICFFSVLFNAVLLMVFMHHILHGSAEVL